MASSTLLTAPYRTSNVIGNGSWPAAASTVRARSLLWRNSRGRAGGRRHALRRQRSSVLLAGTAGSGPSDRRRCARAAGRVGGDGCDRPHGRRTRRRRSLRPAAEAMSYSALGSSSATLHCRPRSRCVRREPGPQVAAVDEFLGRLGELAQQDGREDRALQDPRPHADAVLDTGLVGKYVQGATAASAVAVCSVTVCPRRSS
jgi:hypothetical protein